MNPIAHSDIFRGPTGKTLRVAIYYDDEYRTRGSFALGSDELDKAAEDEEIAKLSSGEWSVYGFMVEELCPHCRTWSWAKDEDCGPSGPSCRGFVTPDNPEEFADKVREGTV